MPEPNEVSLYLKIGPAMYRLDRLGDMAGTPGWMLAQNAGSNLSYTVHRDRFGVHCTCADFVYRKQRTGEPCKHIAGLVEVGLL